MTNLDMTNLDINGLASNSRLEQKSEALSNIGAVNVAFQDAQQELFTGKTASINARLPLLTRFFEQGGLRVLLQYLESGQGFNAAVAAPSAQDTTLPGLPSGTGASQPQDSPVNTEPSDAEKIGARILKTVGGDIVRANQVVQFMDGALTHDMRLLGYMSKVLDALTRKSFPDKLMETPSEGLVLKSEIDLRTQKDELQGIQGFFDRIVEEVTGQVIANETPREAVLRSRKELVELKKNASHDAVVEAVKITSGINPNAGETLAGFLTRVITELKNKTLDDSKYFNAVKGVAKIDPNAGETFEKYFDRAWVKLQADTGNVDGGLITSLLNQLGAKLGVDRNGMKNDKYGPELLKAAEARQSYADALQMLFDELVRIAGVNNLTVGDNETALPLAKRLIMHNRKIGSSIKGV